MLPVDFEIHCLHASRPIHYHLDRDSLGVNGRLFTSFPRPRKRDGDQQDGCQRERGWQPSQPLPEGGTIAVGLAYIDDMVEVTITNPLRASARQSENEGNRMALQNIRNRLSVLYGERADLTAVAGDETFVTTLKFPKMPQTV